MLRTALPVAMALTGCLYLASCGDDDDPGTDAGTLCLGAGEACDGTIPCCAPLGCAGGMCGAPRTDAGPDATTPLDASEPMDAAAPPDGAACATLGERCDVIACCEPTAMCSGTPRICNPGPGPRDAGPDGGRDPSCDDGTSPLCPMPEPDCGPDAIAAVQGSCWVCVNRATCRPWGEPGCESDLGCPAAALCDGCATSSCPACDDCVAGCVATSCATETRLTCRCARPDCGAGNVAIIRDGCWVCVDASTCADVRAGC